MKTSILIPAYNAEKYITETLESIVNQGASLKAINRIVIVDDCSTDSTLSKIVEFKKKHSTIPVDVLQMKANSGERKAVNFGMEDIANDSDWVLIIHADDIAYPQWLEKMLQCILNVKDTTASISSSWDSLEVDGSILKAKLDDRRELIYFDATKTRARDTILMGGWWHISGCAIRLSAAKAVGGFHPDMPQLGDIEFVVRCYSGGWSMEYYPEPLILYRQHFQSVSSRSFRMCRDLNEQIMMFDLHRDLLNKGEINPLIKRVMKKGVRRFFAGLLRLDMLQVRSSLLLLKKDYHSLLR